MCMATKQESFQSYVDSFGWEWHDFKMVLRGMDKLSFEDLLNHARKHPQGLKYVRPTPFEPIVMSILLEHEKIIRHLKNQIKQ